MIDSIKLIRNNHMNAPIHPPEVIVLYIITATRAKLGRGASYKLMIVK